MNFVETKDSGAITQGTDTRSITLEWVGFRTYDSAEVKSSLLALAGTSFEGTPLDTIDIKPQGGGVWLCSAKYTTKEPDDPKNEDDDENLGMSYSIDLTAGTSHITQSKETMSITSPSPLGNGLSIDALAMNVVMPDGYAPRATDAGKSITISGPSPPFMAGTYTITAVIPSGWMLDRNAGPTGATGGIWTSNIDGVGAPSYDQAIGITRDRVEGCDIFTPKFEFSLTVRIYPLTLSFLRAIRSTVGKTNDRVWKGFEAGEVLYLGMTSQAEPDEYWKLTHKFAVGENKENLRVSPQIVVPFKGAWEYLWCAYADAVNAGVRVQMPTGAYVERVYDDANFDILGINPPVCNWTSSEASGLGPLAVQFQDLSTGFPLTWDWDFGDGSDDEDDDSDIPNPIHIYEIPGTYTVSLTVTNSVGSSFKIVTNYVSVS